MVDAQPFADAAGGTNNHNYANVSLITEIAERCSVHAVWAGWGHASENPRLPELLAQTRSKVIWIGPPPHAMRVSYHRPTLSFFVSLPSVLGSRKVWEILKLIRTLVVPPGFGR